MLENNEQPFKIIASNSVQKAQFWKRSWNRLYRNGHSGDFLANFCPITIVLVHYGNDMIVPNRTKWFDYDHFVMGCGWVAGVWGVEVAGVVGWGLSPLDLSRHRIFDRLLIVFSHWPVTAEINCMIFTYSRKSNLASFLIQEISNLSTYCGFYSLPKKKSINSRPAVYIL